MDANATADEKARTNERVGEESRAAMFCVVQEEEVCRL